MLKLFSKLLSTHSHTTALNIDPQQVHASKEPTGQALLKTIRALYGGRSLRIRHVDAGSSNAEEFELTATGNTFYDIEQYGISFVASPRHADILTVSGPVTRNMEHAVLTAYTMMPNPKCVIAVGDGACTGGIWNDSYAVIGAVDKVIPVDYRIPGDPPSPHVFITGLLTAIHTANDNRT